MIPLYASPMKLKANKIVAKKGESKLNPRGFYTHRQSKKCVVVVVGVCVVLCRIKYKVSPIS
jgi:hypothetical protein